MKTLLLETKTCMNHILLRKTFDSFAFIEGEIITANKYNIDGKLHPNYFDQKPDPIYSSWYEIKEYCLSIIKGKRTPLSFHLVFALSKEQIIDFIKGSNLNHREEEISGLYFNFRFDGTKLYLVTGTTLTNFTLDKTIEKSFDDYTCRFFKQQQISCEILS